MDGTGLAFGLLGFGCVILLLGIEVGIVLGVNGGPEMCHVSFLLGCPTTD